MVLFLEDRHHAIQTTFHTVVKFSTQNLELKLGCGRGSKGQRWQNLYTTRTVIWLFDIL